MWVAVGAASVATRFGVIESLTLLRISGDIDQSSSGEIVTDGVLIDLAYTSLAIFGSYIGT
jgi:hypothetical protein